MKIERLRLLASIAGVAALAACSGGGSDDTSDGGGSGSSIVPDLPGDTDSVFVARVQELTSILESPLVSSGDATLPDAPTPGSATFTGSGLIVDTNTPDTVDTVAEALEFAIFATDAQATVNFVDGDVTSVQDNFIDVSGASVAGSVEMTDGSFTPGVGTFTGTVTGSVKDTDISASQQGVIYGEPSDGAVIGSWSATGSDGKYDGIELGGAFAADN